MDAKCSIPLRAQFKLLKTQFHDDLKALSPKKCQGCSFEAVSALLHLRHAVLTACHGSQCDDCYMFFDRKRDFERHVRNQTGAAHGYKRKTGGFNCMRCDYHSPRLDHVRKHIIAKHLTDEEKSHQWHKCDRCDYQTPAKYHLRDHIARKHSAGYVQCEHCDYSTKSERGLKRHLRVRHPTASNEFQAESGGFQCPECEFKHKTMAGVRVHIRIKHLTEEEKLEQWHRCPSCNYRCAELRLMKSHIVRRHSDKTQMEWLGCEFCTYRTKIRINLVAHVRIHHRNPHVTCKVCDEVVLSRHLDAHMADVHNERRKEHQCDVCERSFKKKHSLKLHIQAAHIAAQDRQYLTCPYCSFKTLRSWSLSDHVFLRHNKGDATYHSCTFCQYKSIFPTNVKKHVLRKHTKHEDIVWFSCTLCKYKSSSQSNVKLHVLRIHTKDEDIRWESCGLCEFKSKTKGYLAVHIKQKHSGTVKVKRKTTDV